MLHGQKGGGLRMPAPFGYVVKLLGDLLEIISQLSGRLSRNLRVPEFARIGPVRWHFLDEPHFLLRALPHGMPRGVQVKRYSGVSLIFPAMRDKSYPKGVVHH